ncbi:CpsD/CapB family tyrosine-protein kinase [Sulfitobacter sp. S190]|uniref:CpsD/CapB family tyrosine-protein kinase n=1 Tax=Sulfitobacter sp. S190 TaxID=2867022 RepID=UPI0021A2E5D4|nr:CpsD/CapB family tyrosine-protein kinase [Sulfitobacter sp. S190]UWR23520.1 CpsD/CapB family tyrosine-protein kinase [Sulfitobacter sp. S190]
MKDLHTTQAEDALAPGQELMVPDVVRQTRFTRPRRFGTALRGVDYDPAPLPDLPTDDATEAPGVPATRDLWPLLHVETPGDRQYLIGNGEDAINFRNTEVARAFDLLRTKLRQTAQQHGTARIGVSAPTAGCGATFTAAHLAASLSRVPSSRTVLMDMNLRAPGVARAFDMTQTAGRTSMADFLSGDVALSDHIVRVNDTLALGLSDRAHPNAAEILQDPAAARTLADMHAALTPDLVLYDLPPLLSFDDASGFLPELDGILLVSDGTRTMARHLARCERMLDGHVPLLGVILNRARRSSIERF